MLVKSSIFQTRVSIKSQRVQRSLLYDEGVLRFAPSVEAQWICQVVEQEVCVRSLTVLERQPDAIAS